LKKLTVLYNPKAGNGSGEADTHRLDAIHPDCEINYVNKDFDTSYHELISSIDTEEPVVVSGGDGTLNRLANEVTKEDLAHEILYFPTGSGNDFIHDLGMSASTPPFLLNPYIEKLPRVRIRSKEYKFLNGAGAGFDGYCCAAGNNKRSSSEKKSKRPINYTAIAVKGLLFAFKPTCATITVDGVTHEYKRVWLCPVMKGRFFGGGMMVAPNQDRLDPEGTLTVLVAHKLRPLRMLTLFPSIFKGQHVKYKKYVDVLRGKTIKVELDRPCEMQIDGETVSGVKKYTVFSE
jgi:diacylglycerol kinase family enzyme